MNNNPVRYTDPTGHRCVAADGEDEGCLNDDGTTGAGFTGVASSSNGTSGNASKGCGGPGRPPCRGENHSNIGNTAYFIDSVNLAYSAIVMIVIDVIGAIVIAEGCMAFGLLGCGVGAALVVLGDFAIMQMTPVGTIENSLSYTSVVLTALADYQSGATYFRKGASGLTIGVGQDTIVSVKNLIKGLVPEANYDFGINVRQLDYDNARKSGEITTSTGFEMCFFFC